MATVTIASTVLPDFHHAGTVFTWRIFSDKSWVALDGTVVPGRGNTDKYYKSITLSVSGTNATVPLFTLLSQSDAPNEKNALYSIYLYIDGVESDMFLANTLGAFTVPDTPINTTWKDLEQYNFGTTPRYYQDDRTYSALTIDQKLAAISISGMVNAYNVTTGGAIGDASTNNRTVLQTILDAHPTDIILFKDGTFNSNGPLTLTDSTGRNFRGQLVGHNATVAFTNAGSATDSDIAMQRGFESYPRTNASGGDSSGLGDKFEVLGLNIIGPTNGCSFYSANSTGISFNRGSYNTNRYGIVLETAIQPIIRHIQFDDHVNAGIGLLYTGDSARVWYSTAGESSYWNDSPVIEDCKFTSSTGRAKLAAILDHGSNSEAIRHIRNNLSLGHPYFYLGRKANPTIGPNNWTEDDNYAVRLLTSNASLGAEVNITGITASQPSGTYSRTNFPDGFSFTARVEGNHFVRCINNLNLQGVSAGIGVIGGNVFSGLSGFHLVMTESGGGIINIGESNITNPGTIPTSIGYPLTYISLTRLGEFIEASAAISSVSLTSPASKTIASISLTAGDWDVSGIVYYSTGGSTALSTLASGISQTANTLDGAVGRYMENTYPATVIGNGVVSQVVPRVRVPLTSTTTVYLIGNGTFTSTLTAGGNISARRIGNV